MGQEIHCLESNIDPLLFCFQVVKLCLLLDNEYQIKHALHMIHEGFVDLLRVNELRYVLLIKSANLLLLELFKLSFVHY